MQSEMNEKDLLKSIGYSNFDQEDPFGSVRFEGTPGTDSYRRVTTLNPWEQQNLDFRRQIGAGLLGAALGHQGIPQPKMPDPAPEPEGQGGMPPDELAAALARINRMRGSIPGMMGR